MDKVIEAVQKLCVTETVEKPESTDCESTTKTELTRATLDSSLSHTTCDSITPPQAVVPDLLVCGTKSGSSAETKDTEAISHNLTEPIATVAISTPSHSDNDSDSSFSTPSPSQLCHTELLEINFNVLPENDSDDNDEMSPYIELGGSFQRTHDMCMDKEEIVLTNEEIIMDESEQNKPKYVTLILDYPLDDDYEFKIYPDDKRGFTRGHLIREIKRHYDRVYAEEEETSTVPVGNIPGMMNRVTTDGNYGVWGHDLSDLALHTVSYNSQKNLFWLGVDS
ncbi:hypothetical protein LXG23DRAFT_49482 [Yarrowia lipolytica]|jgi:hypothetical protein|uniref:Uncharacterized protein n=1 Tax=Yarrowia lipolytica TaxID=4952 RepID=A0A1D8NA67_YARLL|nr:hypothetical protein YALI1_C11552g [Yarrowia lipolytica]KAB8280871.1 hypothetical protein BKA91DRAFT_116939 [Yarrowia lipolytica]KAE8169676.1 hypothetical protein BKA90DRAFT_159170 [Yarrowia lipolytica]KAJ8053213.1 hypothetical protein LXG23DRAFT_49482 [Yarrowia lipolytica]RMI94105.1 hypothetical protein BD777DRAFT_155761 [Yarrowia lipolytica]